MDMKFQWLKSTNQIIKEKIVGNDTTLFLANEAKRLMDPYVPADDLVLAQNVRIYVENGCGVVEYNSPYAHYQYEGEVYGPNYPLISGGEVIGYRSPPHKTPTGRKLQYSKFRHPLATSEWDKAMVKARKKDLAKAVEDYIKRGGL